MHICILIGELEKQGPTHPWSTKCESKSTEYCMRLIDNLSQHIYGYNFRPNEEPLRKIQHQVLWQESSPCDSGEHSADQLSYILDLTRNRCGKFNTRSSGRNLHPAIPVNTPLINWAIRVQLSTASSKFVYIFSGVWFTDMVNFEDILRKRIFQVHIVGISRPWPFLEA